jgi:arylsulfatase A-like enzyme
VEFVDIYPSLIELCGLPKPKDAAGLEGKSFVPLLDDPKRAWDKAAFSEYPKGGNQGTAMRTDRYRYVEWMNKKGELVARELYDHQTDPQENENVAGVPANEPVMERLSAQLRAARASATSIPTTPTTKP